ncbi:oligomeric golgi family complex component 8 [Angomonas deanei]|nr:oligomeric golgi family complex component 8 [Angomonas deanei]EPY33461.1 oligomeric golgi family complex component 8 [Angomonas deanei]|eukprot:EPY31492.1 oligomeric golgi family complex component 8 [Angomonas deanei]
MWEETNTIKVPLTRALRCISIYKTYVSEVVLQYEVCLQQDEDELDLLRLFCVKHTKLFVTTFTESISNITSCTELPLIAEQWQTTSPVLTKMHIDVSCAVNASLLTRVKEIFSYHMEQTMTNYRTSSRNFSWRSVPVTSIDLSTGISQLTTPPTQLLHWTPLAYALNGVLGSFNYVRKCMEAGVQQHCAEWVVYLLHCIVGDLRSICERVASAPTENPDRPALENYVRCFLQLFYPYLVSRLQTVLSPANIAWVESQIREDISLLEEGYAKPQQLS